MKNPKPFTRITYSKLNAPQKENYNFAKLSAVMADYGYTLLRLSDDWNGADAIAVHIDGKQFLRIQLKGAGLTFDEKYVQKDIWIACPSEDRGWYVYPHDELLAHVEKQRPIRNTNFWRKEGYYTKTGRMPKKEAAFLQDEGYRLL